jgi:hypothetical protein
MKTGECIDTATKKRIWPRDEDIAGNICFVLLVEFSPLFIYFIDFLFTNRACNDQKCW